MIHVRDVMKWSSYWTDQKPLTDHSSEMTNFMTFSNRNFVKFIQNECCHCFKISKKISDGQEMTKCSNFLTDHTPEIKTRKWQTLFSMECLHNCECCHFIFILFIISVITWKNDNENLPIVPWNFFCEFPVYVTCDTSNWSSEDTDIKNSYFETIRSSGRKFE